MSDINYMAEIRHRIHQHPELAYNEFQTADLVASELKKAGYEVETGIGGTGVTAVLDSGNPGPTVGLRADMDALPLQEKTGLPYASKVEGVMHACGHDGHTATLLGVAKTLMQQREKVQGKIKFIFQPAEEGKAGACAMIEDGVLENPKIDFIFGYHNWPGVRLGHLGVKPGCQLAATTALEFYIRGKGGHAALPHLCDDVVLTGSQLVQSLHALVGRINRATDPAVISITQFRAGQDSHNVLPDQVTLMGTLRTTSSESLARMKKGIEDLAHGASKATGLSVECKLMEGYPATINHEAETQYVKNIAAQVLGAEQISAFDAPSMGGEDFAFFLEKVPGCYFFLGNGEDSPSLHNPKFDYNDKLLDNAHKMMVAIALNTMQLVDM